jgi:hypothetical protein
MSWVADIILLAGLEERFLSKQVGGLPSTIAAINSWLDSHDWAPLAPIDEHIQSEKAFQACAYGAALNHFDVPGFLKVVAKQSWQAPDAVLLLIKNEEERAFNIYRLKAGKLVQQP